MFKCRAILILSFLYCLTSVGQKKKDVQAIKSMCGCFEIEFNFSETFSYTNSKKSDNYKSKALEWAQLVSEDNNKLSIQHLLIVGSKRFPTVIKHWRQDWIYQNTDLYLYDVNNSWIYKEMNKNDVRKQWTQKVFQVDDSPRYEGSASWVHVDGKSFWENSTTAPLPRREYTKRDDYNMTKRGNRHEITSYGWLHDQDNEKINIDNDRIQNLVALEKGINKYKKVDDKECLAAQKWWVDNKEKWLLVRKKWNLIYSKNQNLSLKSNVEGKKLYEYLFNKKYSDNKSISSIIDSFLKF
jgi:hypothetical protein